MSDTQNWRLTPKGHLVHSLMSVFPDATEEKASKVWSLFYDSIYRYADKSSDPDIAKAEYLAIVLDGQGGDLIPVERDDL